MKRCGLWTRLGQSRRRDWTAYHVALRIAYRYFRLNPHIVIHVKTWNHLISEILEREMPPNVRRVRSWEARETNLGPLRQLALRRNLDGRYLDDWLPNSFIDEREFHRNHVRLMNKNPIYRAQFEVEETRNAVRDINRAIEAAKVAMRKAM
jgi:hypothetical protein